MADKRKLSALIVKQLTPEQQDNILRRWKENEDLFLTVKAILDQKKEESRVKQLSSTNYSLACWPEYQADSIGYQRALDEVITLLSLRD